MIRYNMPLEDQAEILATEWMSIGQLEKAGKLVHLLGMLN
jgi:hypothetical protein